MFFFLLILKSIHVILLWRQLKPRNFPKSTPLFPKSTPPWDRYPRKKNWQIVLNSLNWKNFISHKIHDKFTNDLKIATKTDLKKCVLIEELLQGIF